MSGPSIRSRLKRELKIIFRVDVRYCVKCGKYWPSDEFTFSGKCYNCLHRSVETQLRRMVNRDTEVFKKWYIHRFGLDKWMLYKTKHPETEQKDN